ncbi:MAG: hypothetical protein AAF433_22500 [Bacteroidota bacterium]
MPVTPQKWRLNGRPIVVADFGASHAIANQDLSSRTTASRLLGEQERAAPTASAAPDQLSGSSLIQLRHNFPAADSNFEGGESDGYCFKLAFRSSNPVRNLEMIRAFLREQGYSEIPLPQSIQELRAFRLPRRQRRQLHLFGDDGYIHNPIKILFPPPGSAERGLRLEVYNEQAPNHLLRFHGRA